MHLKPFGLKLLYYLSGFPAILMFLVTAKKLETNSMHLVWWTLLGINLITRILIDKEEYETGTIKPSWKTVLLTLTAAGILAYFFILYFLL